MDATNLLKGALGIGTRGSTSRVGDDTTPDLFTNDGSKKQSKAKINNKKAGKQQQQKRGDGKTARTSKKDGDNRSNSAGKDRSKSASKPRKQSSEKQQRGRNKSNNFAWSAFQTSPDPSSLPIPAFSSGGDVGGEASGGGANVNVNETNPISQFGGSTASNSVSKSGSSAAAPTASNADGMDLMATLGVDSGVTPATAPAPAPHPHPHPHLHPLLHKLHRRSSTENPRNWTLYRNSWVQASISRNSQRYTSSLAIQEIIS